MFKYYKFTLAHLILFTILFAFVSFFYTQNKAILSKQEALFYYVNASGKQRVLAQRIVYLSQNISTNFILKKNNHHNLSELRSCINGLLSINSMLQEFILSQATKNTQSTLDDIYFGSGNLAVKIDDFITIANKLFYVSNTQTLLEINRILLDELESKEGLLASIELATLSQQIYGQNQTKSLEKLSYYLFCVVILFILCECLLIFIQRKK